jgi:truncated hemoglobin YjbI
MGQQLQARQFPTWRSGDGEKLWLSMLIEAMDEVSRPELRSLPCDRLLLAAVSAQLARPAYVLGVVSPFSLRN